MKGTNLGVAAAAFAMAAGVWAQPAATDLGTLSANTPATTSFNISPGLVQWYTFTTPGITANPSSWLDMVTNGPVNIDTMIGLYDSAGNRLSSDDDDGPPTGVGFSLLTFGATDVNASGRLAAPAGSTTGFNGRDGNNLPAGLYYLAVTGFSATFGATNWTVTTAHTRSGQVDVWVNFGEDTALSGVGTFSSASCVRTTDGGQGTLRVAAHPAQNPPSTGIGVTVDASQFGLGTVTLFDDGAHDDGGAGDNVFGELITVAPGYGAGTYQLPFTVTDAESRSAGGNIGVTVVDLVGNPNELPSGAEIPQGSGDLFSLSGTFVPSEAHLFQIQVCDAANFSATTVGGTTVDTQLFLFDANGMAVAANDDEVGGATLQSRLTSQFIPGNGVYYLAVSQYNHDPVSSCNSLMFDNAFRVEHGPDGPGAGLPLAAWVNASAATTAYTISLTGACYPGGANPCDVADTNCDGALNGFDVQATEEAVNGDFTNFCQPSADLNGDGAENGFDVEWSEALVNMC
ncbi:hypothetical protein PHYC_03791 [Phycisphaerales bacterium]|nr:hypothetical protein PHYC_03791 [Phycisphaerales bacterium]